MIWGAGQCNTAFLHWNRLSKQSVTAIQCGFQQQFQRSDDPSCNTLPLWVSKWCQEGSVKDSKPQGHPLLAHTMSGR
jgi:hypothetical protein